MEDPGEPTPEWAGRGGCAALGLGKECLGSPLGSTQNTNQIGEAGGCQERGFHVTHKGARFSKFSKVSRL